MNTSISCAQIACGGGYGRARRKRTKRNRARGLQVISSCCHAPMQGSTVGDDGICPECDETCTAITIEQGVVDEQI